MHWGWCLWMSAIAWDSLGYLMDIPSYDMHCQVTYGMHLWHALPGNNVSSLCQWPCAADQLLRLHVQKFGNPGEILYDDLAPSSAVYWLCTVCQLY